MVEDEQEVIGRCLEGDVDAFGLLVDKYQGPVFNAVFHMVRSYEDAREISQEVFLKAFENLSSFNPHRKFFSWIYRIAINESINFVESRRPTGDLPRSLKSNRPDPEKSYESLETSRHVHDALDQLTPAQRSVILLRHFFHLSYREMAEVLEIPEKTVKSRLFDARRNLRDLLANKGY